VLNLLDIWPPASTASAPALAGVLAREYANRFDVIWLRSQPAHAEQSLKRTGFIQHAFPAPLGWMIDKESRLSSQTWYSIPGESE
jgi:hypothetical protein